MSKLLVFGVDSPATAEKVLDLAKDLAKQQLLELADAAWVERTPDGNVKLHQSVNLTAMMAGSGAVTGALWGTLVGLLFLNPLAGAVVGAGVGAGTGAVTGRLTDIGVNDDLIREIGGTLEPGKAAVFFLARNATVDRVIEAIKPYNPKVIQTNLSVDSEKELIEALQGQQVGADSSAQQPSSADQVSSGQQPSSADQVSAGQQPSSADQVSSGQQPSSADQVSSGQQPSSAEQVSAGQQPSSAEQPTS